MTWRVILRGDPDQLHELSLILNDSEFSIVESVDGYAIESTRFSGTDSDVRREAEAMLHLINGALQLQLEHRRQIEISDLIRDFPDGMQERYVYQHVAIRLSENILVDIENLKDGTRRVCHVSPLGFLPDWVTAGIRYPECADVLRLLSKASPDWMTLYKVLEIIGEDVNGIDQIQKKGWATGKSLDRFKHTANSPDAIGDDARHGRGQKRPSKPMSLEEAQGLMFRIINQWMASKR